MSQWTVCDCGQCVIKLSIVVSDVHAVLSQFRDSSPPVFFDARCWATVLLRGTLTQLEIDRDMRFVDFWI